VYFHFYRKKITAKEVKIGKAADKLKEEKPVTLPSDDASNQLHDATSENLTRILDRVILAWLRNKVSIKHLTTPRSLPTSFYCQIQCIFIFIEKKLLPRK
jgi:hypothetical protein